MLSTTQVVILSVVVFMFVFAIPFFGLTFLENHIEKGELFSVIVDTKKIAADFSKSLSENNHLSDDEKVALVKKFDDIYPVVLKKYADKHNVIIFDKSTPLQTAESTLDITKAIENKMADIYLRLPRNKKEITNMGLYNENH